MMVWLVGLVWAAGTAVDPETEALCSQYDQLAARVTALEQRVAVLEEQVAYHEALVQVRVPPEQAAQVHAALDAARAGIERATEQKPPKEDDKQ